MSEERDQRNAPETVEQAKARLEMARVIARVSPFPEDKEHARDEIAWMQDLIEKWGQA